MNRKSNVLITTALLIGSWLLVNGALAQAPIDSLERGFQQPPDSARPRTWWHWTASNVTTEGITKDLEWMKRVGIAGFQLADVNAGGGQTVEKKIVFGTPESYAAVRHAASEADRLGLEMTIFRRCIDSRRGDVASTVTTSARIRHHRSPFVSWRSRTSLGGKGWL